LKKANGKNTNSFFDLDEIKKPLVITQNSSFEIPETVLYDLSTTKGKVYEIVVK
jgi:alpha-L-fucosidase 2